MCIGDAYDNLVPAIPQRFHGEVTLITDGNGDTGPRRQAWLRKRATAAA